ncbi:MAG: hypothetical protein E7290_00655 [Lachnospiraceae bacterium]|nr:hypothetical protein [Lachnospiraceae bacterium]
MKWMEIALFVIGVGAFMASFMISDKRDKARRTEETVDPEVIRQMIDKEMQDAKDRVSEVVDETLNYAVEKTERASERISNEKIMAISEYSETVLADMNKTHQEVMFLYDMLNDKHENLKETAKKVDKQVKVAEETASAASAVVNALAVEKEAVKEVVKEAAKTEQAPVSEKKIAKPVVKKEVKPATEQRITLDMIQPELTKPEFKKLSAPSISVPPIAPQAATSDASKNVEVYSFAQQAPKVERPVKKEAQAVNLENSMAKQNEQKPESKQALAAKRNVAAANNNDRILDMHKQGMSSVAIAKELGLGVGEVKLVINLFKGAV